jgi:hypothetical protein
MKNTLKIINNNNSIKAIDRESMNYIKKKKKQNKIYSYLFKL